jgi:hypothetical protein
MIAPNTSQRVGPISHLTNLARSHNNQSAKYDSRTTIVLIGLKTYLDVRLHVKFRTFDISCKLIDTIGLYRNL